MNRFKGRSTLRLVQSIKTVPRAFPTTMNTCGRMCVHKSGRFVVVSNRGHQSITVFRVKNKGSKRGELQTVGCFHTRGETPRHFQFDNSGQYLLVANQDSNSIAVFNFNFSNGQLKYSGNEYRVPSPNFVCCCPMHAADEHELPPLKSQLHLDKMLISPSSTISTSSSAVSSIEVTDGGRGRSTSLGSDISEDSTVPVWGQSSSGGNVKAELAQAKREIESLRKLLAEKA